VPSSAGWCHEDKPTHPQQGFFSNLLAASHNGVGVVGVFGSCRILPIKTWEYPYIADDAWVAKAIRYAGQQGARVISNSWGYLTPDPKPDVANAITDVVNNCGKFDSAACVMIFSAGNGGEGHSIYSCPYDDLPAVHFPANMPEVIAVGAMDNTGARWDYSSYGSALDVMAPSGRVCDDQSAASSQWTVDQMDVYGWNPLVTGAGDADGDRNYTSVMGGTSGACPQVAGIAALLLARGHDSIRTCNPGPKIREIITRTATDMGTAGWDQYYGYGLANAYRAMLSIIRGDVNNDGVIDVEDVVMEIGIAFSGGSAVLDDSVGDVDIVNSPGVVEVMDVIYLVAYVFGGGPPPPICYE
jgi:subtilisin family serine protease